MTSRRFSRAARCYTPSAVGRVDPKGIFGSIRSTHCRTKRVHMMWRTGCGGTDCTCRPATIRRTGPPRDNISITTIIRLWLGRRSPLIVTAGTIKDYTSCNTGTNSRRTANRLSWPPRTCRPTAVRQPSTWRMCSAAEACTRRHQEVTIRLLQWPEVKR